MDMVKLPNIYVIILCPTLGNNLSTVMLQLGHILFNIVSCVPIAFGVSVVKSMLKAQKACLALRRGPLCLEALA